MKTTLVIFLAALSVTAQAQTPEARVAPSCGPDQVKFKVKTQKIPPQMGQPEAGKARVYFFEDNAGFGSFPKLTTRAGVDGEWVGATRGNSYFYFSVDPGEHHLCASWQNWLGPGVDVTHKTAVAHFTAEGGAIYYFKAGAVQGRGTLGIHLEPLDSDEAHFLASKFSFSTVQQKQ